MRMVFLRLLILSALLILLSACGSDSVPDPEVEAENASAPQISRVYSDVTHYHPSFWDKWNETHARTIQQSFNFKVEDPQGLSNIQDIYIYNAINGGYYNIYGGPDNIPLEKFYRTRSQDFSASFFTWESRDRAELKNWRVVAIDKDGNVSEREFEFVLPNSEPLEDETYAFSAEYIATDPNGIAALEVLTIDDNGLAIEADPGSQSFNIKFRPTDVRASNYSIAFYGAAPEYKYLGWANQRGPSIASQPIVTGQQTSLDLPWSEIYFENGGQLDDINGAHVTLYNDSVDNEIVENSIWFSYLSYSEYFTLEN